MPDKESVVDLEYEEMLERMLGQIAVYSDEWTNMLPSDPGIMVLENLAAFLLLQKERLLTIPEQTKELFPLMLGMEVHGANRARVLLKAVKKAQQTEVFPKYQKFFLEDLCFETTEETYLPPGQLTAVYREKDGILHEIKELQETNPIPAQIFGTLPKPGDSIYFLFHGSFGFKGGSVCLYVTGNEVHRRNPPDNHYPLVFAEAKWSYYTEAGYQPVARCMDETSVFLKSGEIRLTLGAASPAEGMVGRQSGFILKCELKRQEYDSVPSVLRIDGPLFEVREQETKADIWWDQEMEIQKSLGVLYGYDNQEFLLGVQGKIVEESLEIRVVKQNGTDSQNFSPKDTRIGMVNYEYDSVGHIIRVLDAGDFEGGTAEISRCSVHHGKDGNILAGNLFLREGVEASYINPASGQGGREKETGKELLERVQREWKNGGTLVTEADYEQAVRQTPDLCIHKVKARLGEDNILHIFVKPFGTEEFPGLPSIYEHQILAILEERRLLNMKIRISGPVYTRIDVWTDVTVKLQYTDSRRQIEEVISRELDYVDGPQPFGSIVSARRLLSSIESLPCVQRVQELTLMDALSKHRAGMSSYEESFYLPAGVLCSVGRMDITVSQETIL